VNDPNYVSDHKLQFVNFNANSFTHDDNRFLLSWSFAELT